MSAEVGPIRAESRLLAAQSASQSAADQGSGDKRDGSHDFDFNIGVWRTHIRRVLDPLSDSNESMELNGTVTVREVWDGRAQLEEIEADGRKGHWEGLTLFLYNPQPHQWSQSFINNKIAELGAPLIGELERNRTPSLEADRVRRTPTRRDRHLKLTGQCAH